MIETIKPIETFYAGRHFRSRLEARWAVFYTMLGIPWLYEPEGFTLANDLRYLPDFYLPHLDVYIEIKPTEPTELESLKAERLAHLTRTRVFIFFGQPGFTWYPPGQVLSDSAHVFDGVADYDGQAAWDNYQAWCVCLTCGAYGIEFEGRSGRLACGCGPDHDAVPTPDDQRLLAAYDEANQARFST